MYVKIMTTVQWPWSLQWLNCNIYVGVLYLCWLSLSLTIALCVRASVPVRYFWKKILLLSFKTGFCFMSHTRCGAYNYFDMLSVWSSSCYNGSCTCMIMASNNSKSTISLFRLSYLTGLMHYFMNGKLLWRTFWQNWNSNVIILWQT